MGTRHIIKVIKNGEVKINQYGQWDGYPEGQGERILKFFKNKKRVSSLHKKLDRVRFLDDTRDNDFIEKFDNPQTRTPEMSDWYDTYIHRDLGAMILTTVTNSKDKEILLMNSGAYIGDIWIQWEYEIDLDKNTLKVSSCGMKQSLTFQLDNLPKPKEFYRMIKDVEND